jgi:hypothetical protein
MHVTVINIKTSMVGISFINYCAIIRAVVPAWVITLTPVNPDVEFVTLNVTDSPAAKTIPFPTEPSLVPPPVTVTVPVLEGELEMLMRENCGSPVVHEELCAKVSI